MKSRRLLIIGCLFVLSWLILWIFVGSSRQPSCGGKSLSEWSAQLERAHRRDYPLWPVDLELSRKAIRAIGTNGLPFFMAEIHAHASLKDRFAGWLMRLKVAQALGAPTGANRWTIADRWNAGVHGLEVLGPLARPCLRELITLAATNRDWGGRALLAVGPDALPTFTNLIVHSQFPVSSFLIQCLAEAVDESRISSGDAAIALPVLVRAFQSTNEYDRRNAASAMGAIHRQADLCVPILIAGLGDLSRIVRENCVKALGKYGREAGPYAAQLAEVFITVDPTTRSSMCSILPNTCSAESVTIAMLKRGLADPDPNVRAGIVNASGEIGALPDGAAGDLAKALEEPDLLRGSKAVEALANLSPVANSAISSLKQAAVDPDRNVRNLAANALRRIAESYLHALPSFGDQASVPAGRLAELFDAVDANTRSWICVKLPPFRAAGGVAVRMLSHALADPDEGVRVCAVHGLSMIQDRPNEVIPALVQALQDTEPKVRVQAVQSIEKLNDHAANAVAALIQACADADENVRNAATNALKRWPERQR